MQDKKAQEERRKRNEDLLLRWKNGESTVLSTAEDSHWPNHPAIKKDPKLMSKLFDKGSESE